MESAKNHILFATAVGAPQMFNDEIRGIIATVLAAVVSTLATYALDLIKRKLGKSGK